MPGTIANFTLSKPWWAGRHDCKIYLLRRFFRWDRTAPGSGMGRNSPWFARRRPRMVHMSDREISLQNQPMSVVLEMTVRRRDLVR